MYERHETIVTSTEGALFQIAYISDNASDSSPEQLSLMMEDIQLASKRNNTEDNISGALMFNQQCFAQILEGESEVIEATFERIQSDPRHHNVQVLEFGPIEQRSFPEWAMAFVGETQENSSEFNQLSLIHAKSSEDNQGLKLQRLLLQLVENSTSTLKAA
ncbi:MAG: BLUF domain-containing protein [Granulosicoccus sp.]